ncbi:hypothetical protein JHK87_055737 [Glycine soja]|nr:hypothetical protein JHK87_055737 [Glycine soja]
MESIKVMASVDLSLTLPDKKIVVQKEPVPPGKKISPELQEEICPYVELCPDAVVREYLLAPKQANRALWMEELQKHLVCLGWKIEWANKNNVKRYGYDVPDKKGRKLYLSLIEVCRVMEKDPNMNVNVLLAAPK